MNPRCPAPSRLSQALPDLAAWSAHFQCAPLPVLDDTALRLEQLRAAEDAVDAHLIAQALAHDPLMTLKLLAHVAGVRSARRCADPQTLTSALLLLGVAPFFRAFGPQPTVAALLADLPQALAGLQAVLARAHRAAGFALGFAVHRMDPDAAVLHAAALLHDFAEMLLWLHAPALALRIAQAQRADPGLRSATAQRAVLHIELAELQQALLRTWHLPALLLRIDDDRHADSAPVRNVRLAVRIARHSACGWDNPAIDDDVRDIATLLNLGETPTRKLLRELDG